MNTEKEVQEALDAVVQAEITNDSEFQTTYAALASDEEKAAALETKRASILAAKAPEFFAEAKKQGKIASDQKIRAEKAEGGKKPSEEGKQPDAAKEDELSQDDIFILVEAKVPREDIGEVKKASKLLGKSIAETLNDPLVQSMLKQSAELRATAKATNIDPKRPGTNAPSDAEILDRASKGEVFKPGSPEAEQLFWARRGGKKSS